MQKYYWIIVYPKRWIFPRSEGWIYEIQTLSYLRKDAINKILQDFDKETWKDLYKDGRRCIKVTIQELN